MIGNNVEGMDSDISHSKALLLLTLTSNFELVIMSSAIWTGWESMEKHAE